MKADPVDHCLTKNLLRTCVRPDGRFIVAHHRSSFTAANLRGHQRIGELGRLEGGQPVSNQENFPEGPIEAHETDGVYEIANPLPFRGVTFIGKGWADATRRNLSSICLPPPADFSMTQWLRDHLAGHFASSRSLAGFIKDLPEPLQIALAVNSTDPQDLIALAEAAGEFVYDPDTGNPAGLRFVSQANGNSKPLIHDLPLFEAVANNPRLPDDFKDAMVLRPGAQGNSPIVGEWSSEGGSHVYEYLRYNSYIPWGHFAANMANDAIRYRAETLTMKDMTGMRHLYYQRTFVRLAQMLGVLTNFHQKALSPRELEALRMRIRDHLAKRQDGRDIPMNGVLWGWNLGFDYTPSHYRMHASHQQVHQQYALIPRHAPQADGATDDQEWVPTYACGDQIDTFIRRYRESTGVDFFTAYIDALEHNTRTDGRTDGDCDLVVFRDEHVMVFVPKAQTSQWELQIIPTTPVGNVLEADAMMRASLDRALLMAVRTLWNMGARMITTFEYSKRLDAGHTGQRLLYSLLPRLPESPGAFSEAQLRWITGHYPEDFATICRSHRPSPEEL